MNLSPPLYEIACGKNVSKNSIVSNTDEASPVVKLKFSFR